MLLLCNVKDAVRGRLLMRLDGVVLVGDSMICGRLRTCKFSISLLLWDLLPLATAAYVAFPCSNTKTY